MAVITEVLHMLDFNRKTQIDFLKWIEGGLQIQSFTQEQIPRFDRAIRKICGYSYGLSRCNTYISFRNGEY